jgi:excisionase family DNA binding protein
VSSIETDLVGPPPIDDRHPPGSDRAMSASAVWLSTEDVARDTGMSSQWVRRQIAARRLRAMVYRTGRRHTIRIARAELEAFLAEYSSR